MFDVSLSELVDAVRRLEQDVDDAVRIDRIRLLEELKSVAAAAQAAETVAFAESQRAAQVGAGVKPGVVARSVAAQVGLARRVSPFHARRYVGWSKILTSELPGRSQLLPRDGSVSGARCWLRARRLGCPANTEPSSTHSSHLSWTAWAIGEWKPKLAGSPSDWIPRARQPRFAAPRPTGG